MFCILLLSIHRNLPDPDEPSGAAEGAALRIDPALHGEVGRSVLRFFGLEGTE
jgi:hypothetical protein